MVPSKRGEFAASRVPLKRDGRIKLRRDKTSRMSFPGTQQLQRPSPPGSQASSQNSSLPDLPGFTYDPNTNRYYKTPTNPSTTVTPPHSSEPEPIARRSPLHRYLHAVTIGTPLPSVALAAKLLAHTYPENVSERAAATTTNTDPSTIFSYVARSSPNMIQLRTYPSGADCYTTAEGGPPVLQHVYKPGVLVYMTRRDEVDARYALTLCVGQELMTRGFGLVQTSITCLDVVAGTSGHEDGTERPALVAAGTHGQICLLAEGQQTQFRVVQSLRLPGVGLQREGPTPLVARWDSHSRIAAGTRCGRVAVWSLTDEKYLPTWRGLPSGKNHSITDIRFAEAGNLLFASCLRNGPNNLAAWDLRVTADKGPAVVYGGHVNSHRRLWFDIQGGLLAAGGEDNVVRLWDVRKGGFPMECMRFGARATNVKLVGWSGRQGRPGMWVETEDDLLVLEVGRSAFR